MPTSKDAAIVGAAGFLGSALATRFRSLGVHTACFTRSNPFVDGAGRLDAELRAADTVFWLASSVRPATADSHADRVAADRRALETLLDGLDRSGSEPLVVVVSSGGTVYDPRPAPPHHEESPIRPVNAYGEAMYELEQLVRAAAPRSTVLRVSNAYGPGQPARRGQGVIAHWLSSIAADAPVRIIGPDSAARDYVYVDDVIEALVRSHQADEVPRLLNIGSGQATTLADLLDAVRGVVAPRDVTVIQEPARGFDAPSTWLDVSRAATDLQWVPRTSLRDGLAATWHSVVSLTSPVR